MATTYLMFIKYKNYGTFLPKKVDQQQKQQEKKKTILYSFPYMATLMYRF